LERLDGEPQEQRNKEIKKGRIKKKRKKERKTGKTLNNILLSHYSRLLK